MKEEPVVEKELKTRYTDVGLDAHKRSIKVGVLAPDVDEPEMFTIRNTAHGLKKMSRRVKKTLKRTGSVARCWYEAGTCGFELQRQVEALGLPCSVIAPSKQWRPSVDRVKTDRLDAAKLAKQGRMGVLSVISAPSRAEEGMRDVWRLREQAREDLQRTRHRLDKFLTRLGRIYGSSRQWTKKHMEWVCAQRFWNEFYEEAFHGLLEELLYRERKLEERTRRVEELSAADDVLTRKTGWLRCLMGVDTLTAVGLSVELYEAVRFGSAAQLMSFLGLTPSERSSGEKERKGGITRDGNHFARRLLIETAWHYRGYRGISKGLLKRQEGQPAWVVKLAIATQKRLCRKARRLLKRGKAPQKIAVAIARELVGVVWILLTTAEAGDGPPPNMRVTAA